MTLYQRPDEHVFAQGARPGEVQPFPDLSRGWGVAFEQTGGIPPMEWFNFIGKRADEAIRYLMQRGLPEWSETEDYPEGSYIQYSGKTYRAKAANQGKPPQISLAEWEEWGLTREALDAHFHPKDGELAWPKITETPTTLNGYGITDAATAQEVQNEFTALHQRFHPKNGPLPWAKISDKPSTLTGYGITDAAPIANPAFTGQPTAPTPSAQDRSTRIATTASTWATLLSLFIGPDRQSFQGNGFQKLPGGLILQWGFTSTHGNGMSNVIFPIKFSTKCLAIHGTHLGTGCATVIEYVGTRTNIGATLRTLDENAMTRAGWGLHWFAIGH
ncbi:MAG: Carbohydrate binding domain-containing protein [Glomeribacter sp. 1016415]|nr:Carbohydrate binding domain-containing protein [Glomeribacter sp. 1016415]